MAEKHPGSGGGKHHSMSDDETHHTVTLGRKFVDKCKQLAFVLAIVWIALIGIFAIEQIKTRGEVLRAINARKAEIATKLENVRRTERSARAAARTAEGAETEPRLPESERAALEDEQAALNNLTDRVTTLALAGSMTTRGSLHDIVCDLVMTRKGSAPPPATPAVACRPEDEYRTLPRLITLQHLSERGANGALLAVLIITAAIGGAVIRLSLNWGDHKPQALQTLLRAIGGGIVCYLVLDGGQFPLSSFDVTKYTSPATASLMGLLSGMFSDKLFTLLGDLVDTLVERITPDKKSNTSKSADTPKRSSHAESPTAVVATPQVSSLAKTHAEAGPKSA